MKERCSEVSSLLEDFLDGTLPDKQEVEVRKHLSECSACRLEMETAREVIQTLSTLPEIRCSEHTRRIIEETTLRKEARPSILERMRFPGELPFWKTASLAVAAAAVICLLLFHPFAARQRQTPPRYTNQEALEARAVARQGLVRVAGVISRTERKAVSGLLRKDLPDTVRRTIRNATPFRKGGKV